MRSPFCLLLMLTGASNACGVGVQSFSFYKTKEARYDVPRFFCWCGRREFGTWLAVNSAVSEANLAQARTAFGVGVQSFSFYKNKKGEILCISPFLLVRETGIEPVRFSPHAPQTCASASSATPADAVAIATTLYIILFFSQMSIGF